MKKFLPFIPILLLSVSLRAQVTITSASLPELGDTITRATDNLPGTVNLKSEPGQHDWDFTELNAPFATTRVFENANEGNSFQDFPDATYVTILAAGVEEYFSKENNALLQLGYSGADLLGLDFAPAVRYSPPLVNVQTPISYGTQQNSISNALIPFAAEDIPFGIFDSLPISPDSFRIKIEIERAEIADGFGNLTLEEGNYAVLRVKRYDNVSVRLEAKIPFLDWQDITDLLPGFDLLGDNLNVSHLFLAEGEKQPIVTVNMAPNTEDEITTVEFKTNAQIVNSDEWIDTNKRGVYSYPNPAINEVKIELIHFEPDNYELVVYNIIGMPLIRQRLDTQIQNTFKVDISSLARGTYLYSIKNREGITLSSKRLSVIKP